MSTTLIPTDVAQPEAASAPVQTAHPVSDTDRLPLIDILRGVALLGILLINIPGFAMPQYYSEAFRSNSGDGNFWLYAFISVFWEGKMRALFGMVFGAGVLLFTAKKEAVGRPVTGLFYRRMFWLLVFGLIHAHLLLWEGDILYFYAICGMIIFLFRNMKARHLVWFVPVVAVLDFGIYATYYSQIRSQHIAYGEAVQARDSGAELTESQTTALTEWRELEKSIIPNREDAAENTRKMKGDYASVGSVVRPLAFRLETIYLPISIPDSVALMLFGMALLKWGFLGGKWSRRTYWRLVALGYGLGLPLVIFSFYHTTVHNPTMEAALAHMDTQPIPWVRMIYPFQRLLLVMAHASLVILIFQGGWLKSLGRRLAAVGQMAFTNYITHTIICSLVFFGYGLNYFAEMDYYQIFGVAIAIWIFQLIVSPWWLERFQFGPLEWLWRSLTYWKKQPFRRVGDLLTPATGR
jgi:uncharacterized protein